MKKLSYILIFTFIVSCTSNTIFEKPKDLIPRDTMSLLIQELMVASSAKFKKNTASETNVNYMPFVYNKFKIDSTRFSTSNFYYASKIDIYKEILEDAKEGLEKYKTHYTDLKTAIDSIRKDSIDRHKAFVKRVDSIRKDSIDNYKSRKKRLDSIYTDSVKNYKIRLKKIDAIIKDSIKNSKAIDTMQSKPNF